MIKLENVRSVAFLGTIFIHNDEQGKDYPCLGVIECVLNHDNHLIMTGFRDDYRGVEKDETSR